MPLGALPNSPWKFAAISAVKDFIKYVNAE